MERGHGRAGRFSGTDDDLGRRQPEYIAQSWARSVQFGLDPGGPARVAPVSEQELRIEIERNDGLYHRCRPELEALRAVIESSGSLAALADPTGLILASVGAEQFTRRARNAPLCPGALWNESLRGTNGIGVVLAERRPLSVYGEEHFVAANRFMTCSAAPILTPQGSVAGVFNISSLNSASAPLTLGLVTLSVDQIEHRFFAQGFDRCQVLRLHTERDLLGTAREGILVFDDSKLVAANRYGLALLNLDWTMIGHRRFDELFEADIRKSPTGFLRSHAGQTFHISTEAKRPQVPVASSRLAPTSAPHIDPVYDGKTLREIEHASRIIAAGIPVLVTGETGVGKELLARKLHALSTRAQRPFVAVNCAALPETLIESELFGYVEGAFTGAGKRGSQGLLREAHGGFLFLDEIGDMPIALQARLLRVLQDREVRPLGSARAVAVDFSLVCATHRNLRDAVAHSAFREDLYYRIAQFVVELRPLREAADPSTIISDLWRQITGGDARYALDGTTISCLAAYHWPGNYRQLSALLRTLAALATPGTAVTVDSLPAEIRERSGASSIAVPTSEDLDGITRSILRAAVERENGNVSRAARSLGINRSTLYRRLNLKKDT
jgi:transcriptional regulator of acetoin/glycerol metabolism